MRSARPNVCSGASNAFGSALISCLVTKHSHSKMIPQYNTKNLPITHHTMRPCSASIKSMDRLFDISTSMKLPQTVFNFLLTASSINLEDMCLYSQSLSYASVPD